MLVAYILFIRATISIVYYREFIAVCSSALDLNGRLIEGDQLEYQENMRQNFRDMVTRLADILEEQVLIVHLTL